MSWNKTPPTEPGHYWIHLLKDTIGQPGEWDLNSLQLIGTFTNIWPEDFARFQVEFYSTPLTCPPWPEPAAPPAEHMPLASDNHG